MPLKQKDIDSKWGRWVHFCRGLSFSTRDSHWSQKLCIRLSQKQVQKMILMNAFQNRWNNKTGINNFLILSWKKISLLITFHMGKDRKLPSMHIAFYTSQKIENERRNIFLHKSWKKREFLNNWAQSFQIWILKEF